MTILQHTIKEKGNTLMLQFQVKQLEVLPMKVAMKTLEILEKNNKVVGYFVEFDEKTQEFINKNKELYTTESEKESKNFKKLSDLYFDYMDGPLYVYGERVLEMVSKVYEIEPLVFNIDIKVPKITYTLMNNENHYFEKVLNVKNTQDLIEIFGKAITLQTLVLFKDHLNYDYQIKNKVKKNPYGISNNIKAECFNNEKGIHEFLESFKGKNYILEQAFNDQMKKINTPEEILELMIIKENLKSCLNNPEDKYEAKPNSAMPTDVWYLKNNVIHREGDLPARECKDGGVWYKNGKIHREDDLPASVSVANKSWYKEGLCHRDNDLPAQIIRGGDGLCWYKNGEQHREGAPAYIKKAHSFYFSEEEWWHEGKKHRIDGPAVIIAKDQIGQEKKEWWLDGVQIAEKDFAHEVSKRKLHEKLQEDLVPLENKGRKVKI